MCRSDSFSALCQCDSLCGDGQKTRQVLCHRVTDTQTVLLDSSECQVETPNATEPCFLRPCEGVDWISSPWSGVSAL